jgi:N-acetylneuraminic acid mutarotase
MLRRNFLKLSALALTATQLPQALSQTKDTPMPTYKWTLINDNAPFAPRDGAGALTFNNQMFLLGGWNPSDKINFPKICNSEVWSSTDGKSWKLLVKQAPWEGRHTAGYAVHNNLMYIVGGDCNQGHYQNDVWSSPDGINWTQLTNDAPFKQRVLHYTVPFKNQLWVFGGQTLPNFAPCPEGEIFFSDAWSSPDGKTWTKQADNLPWGPRGMIGGHTVLHDKIFLIAGGTYDTPKIPTRKFFNDVWSSPDGINWTCVAKSTPFHPRQYHDVATFHNQLWVMEGYHRQGGNRKDVWHSPDGINWHEIPNTPWAPRHAASLFLHDNALWMVAGNNMTSDVWKLTKA